MDKTYLGYLPGQRTPGSGKERDEDADESNASLESGGVGNDSLHFALFVEFLVTAESAAHCHDELGSSHASGADEKELAATKLIDSEDTRDSGEGVDCAGDHLDGEVVVHASALEVLGSIVKNEIDTY